MRTLEAGSLRTPPASAAPTVVDHLAELTGFRDRDRLDATLATAFVDLLHPRLVAVWRTIGDDDDLRWLSRARIAAGSPVAEGDPPWTEVDQLPRLDDDPDRALALGDGCPVFVDGDPHRSLFPVTTDLEVVGVVELHTDAPLDATQRGLVAGVLRVFRNFEALLDYSERDTLTGLLNRKTFDESFLKIAVARQTALPPDGRRAAAAQTSHWLGVIDIDHFKRVNDQFGHLIGDEVLLLLARLMRGTFRYGDRLYRFGGEEFVVIVRCADEAGAALAYERLRAAVEAHAFPQVGRITVSVGFTEVKAGDTPSAAFERADRAVYYAKGNGRNQVQSHAALVERGEFDDGAKVGDVELF
jgi:diguanylate cyclase (GGDEF)-like protein